MTVSTTDVRPLVHVEGLRKSFGAHEVLTNIDLGYARVRASRITYVGELGYELYMPTEFATHVFDRLAEAGPEFGLKNGGYFAINALRMEKGYRHWGHDIGEEDTPLQAGLALP